MIERSEAPERAGEARGARESNDAPERAGEAREPASLFDTHAHLHFPDFAPDLDDVMARARAVGVQRLVTIGTDRETSQAAVAIAERDPNVWASVGLHPHDAEGGDDALFADLEALAASPRVVAIGEMGLDFFRNLSPRPTQEAAFRRQIALARSLRKPVIVHCRDAHEETLAILAEERVHEVGGVMHCFSGDVAVARRCLDLGLLISIAGPVTYPNARALPDVVRFAPVDRLVVETDCPFLPPQPYRGKRNEPSYLTITASRVADLRKESLEELGPRMTENALRLFGIR